MDSQLQQGVVGWGYGRQVSVFHQAGMPHGERVKARHPHVLARCAWRYTLHLDDDQEL